MKIALVHDYLTQRGGAERVFEILCKYIDNADVFTSLYDPKKTINLNGRRVYTSFLQKVPGSARNFRLFTPFYFSAFQSLNLQDYDLIISSTSSFAKAIRKRSDALHVCFCHNVTRFLWDTKTYLQEYQDYRVYYPLIEKAFYFLRKIDLEYSKNPDIYIANSHTVADRIQNIYGRDSLVINYPIDDNKFFFQEKKEEFYLVSSRLLSYKRIDLIIEAFNWLGWPLLILGEGPERQNLQARALDNIQFLGYVSDSLRASLMARSRALVVAALEDYGLVPIEANVSGTPVVAFGKGGIMDTQVDGKTGILFSLQTTESLIKALIKEKNNQWNYQEIREHALNNFTEKIFFQKVHDLIQEIYGSSVASMYFNNVF